MASAVVTVNHSWFGSTVIYAILFYFESLVLLILYSTSNVSVYFFHTNNLFLFLIYERFLNLLQAGFFCCFVNLLLLIFFFFCYFLLAISGLYKVRISRFQLEYIVKKKKSISPARQSFFRSCPLQIWNHRMQIAEIVGPLYIKGGQSMFIANNL